MATGSFPSDPGQRKVILVLQQHDIEQCSYEPGAAEALLDEEAYILRFPVQVESSCPSTLQNLINAGMTRPGSVLVQSPYDPDAYEEVSLAPQRFALAKHMYFSTLCMHLGAKEVCVEQIDLRTRTGKTSLDVTGGYQGCNASVGIGNDDLETFKAQMNLHDRFAGGPPDIVSAEKLLIRTGLLYDPTMSTLLEMRREGANQLLTRKLVLSLSNEAKSNLKVAGRLKIPSFIKLSADYNRVVNEQLEYFLTATVRF